MADDIFLTQEEQDERAKKWLRENGPAILIGIVLGLVGIYGYDEYRIYQIKQAERASLAYSQVLELTEGSELADISAHVEELKSDYKGTPYAAKAALLKAKQLMATDMDAALAELDWALEHADERPVWHAANIRKAKLLIAQEKTEQALAIAKQEPYEGFASQYYEVLGDAYAQSGDAEQAANAYQMSIDALSPADAGYARILTLKQNQLSSNVDAESATQADDNATSSAVDE